MNRRVDEVWCEIFNMKNPVTEQQRFPVLGKLITGLLVILVMPTVRGYFQWYERTKLSCTPP